MCENSKPTYEDLVLIVTLIKFIDIHIEKFERISKPKTFFNDLLALGCGGVWVDSRQDYRFLSLQGAIHFRWLSW
jgi:hypothetical protein